MLSITAASLSRKDVLIAEAESKVTSMTKIIDSLTDSNAQLMHRIEQLESSLASYADGSVPSSDFGGRGANSSAAGRRHDVQFERIDTLMAQEDERMDRTNRMLLETMFGMARMVESCAIQMSKDVMDSLEYQLDGSVLQNLAEMVRLHVCWCESGVAVDRALRVWTLTHLCWRSCSCRHVCCCCCRSKPRTL